MSVLPRNLIQRSKELTSHSKFLHVTDSVFDLAGLTPSQIVQKDNAVKWYKTYEEMPTVLHQISERQWLQLCA
jgi:hypothetical protein